MKPFGAAAASFRRRKAKVDGDLGFWRRRSALRRPALCRAIVLASADVSGERFTRKATDLLLFVRSQGLRGHTLPLLAADTSSHGVFEGRQKWLGSRAICRPL
jgi:hypothetical protein